MIELALVIAILALVLGAVLVPLSTQLKSANVREAKADLSEIRDALLGFATGNGHLPCPEDPALVPDGLEDRDPNTLLCDVEEGILPWRELGVRPDDRWGRHYHYRPGAQFTLTIRGSCPQSLSPPPTPRLDLCDVGDAIVQERFDDIATPAVREKTLETVVDRPAAIVVSFGANGYGARAYGGGVIPAPPGVGADELANYTNEVPPVFRVRTVFDAENAGCDDADPTVSFCPFDDVVEWLPTSVFFAQMVKAGQLPN